MELLFVCTGNTCRSPMAAGIFNAMVRENGEDNRFAATSAGVYAISGYQASEHAVAVCREHGIDISSHRSRDIEGILEDSDLILTMTGSQKNAIMYSSPDCGNILFTLSEFSGIPGDVADPFGAGKATYEKTFETLFAHITAVRRRLVQGAA